MTLRDRRRDRPTGPPSRPIRRRAAESSVVCVSNLSASVDSRLSTALHPTAGCMPACTLAACGARPELLAALIGPLLARGRCRRFLLSLPSPPPANHGPRWASYLVRPPAARTCGGVAAGWSLAQTRAAARREPAQAAFILPHTAAVSANGAWALRRSSSSIMPAEPLPPSALRVPAPSCARPSIHRNAAFPLDCSSSSLLVHD